MTARKIIAAAGLVGVALIAITKNAPWRPLLIWNATASVPIGLYRLQTVGDLTVGDLVVVTPPPRLAELFAERGYLPNGVPLIKPIAALSGATVCRAGAIVTVGGTVAAAALGRDHKGEPLPVWQGCVQLLPDQVFLLATKRPDSLDGRYFGPTSLAAIVGRATPILPRESR